MIAMRGSKGSHRCFPLLGGPVPFFLSKAWEEFGVKFDWLCISLQELGLGQSLTLPGRGGITAVLCGNTLGLVVWSVEESFKHSLSLPPSRGVPVP